VTPSAGLSLINEKGVELTAPEAGAPVSVVLDLNKTLELDDLLVDDSEFDVVIEDLHQVHIKMNLLRPLPKSKILSGFLSFPMNLVLTSSKS